MSDLWIPLETRDALLNFIGSLDIGGMATEPDIIKVPTERYHEMVAETETLRQEAGRLRAENERQHRALTSQAAVVARLQGERDAAEARADAAERTIIDQANQLTVLRSNPGASDIDVDDLEFP